MTSRLVQFVYDPHIAPQVQAWNEARKQAAAERRRRNRARQQGPIAAPPVMSEASPASLARSIHDSDHDDHDGVSVELEDLVTKEVAEWKTTTGPHGTLTRRKVRTHDVLDEVCLTRSSPSDAYPRLMH